MSDTKRTTKDKKTFKKKSNVVLLKDKNSHEKDNKIRFDEAPHIYYISGKAYDTSVTKFVHSYFPCFNAKKAIKAIRNSVKHQQPSSEYYGKTDEQIEQGWKANGAEASKAGTKMHKSIENFYNKLDYDNDSIEFKYFLDFHEKVAKNKLIPYRTEWEIFDSKLRLAGSIDMIYKRRGKEEYVIYDWKRCKNICDYNKYETAFKPLEQLPNCNKWQYSLQLNMYKYMLEQNYGIKIHSMILLCLHPINDDYILIPVPDLTEEIELIVEERMELLEGIKPKTTVERTVCDLEKEVSSRCMIDSDSDDEIRNKKLTTPKKNNSKTNTITKPKITTKKRTKCMIDSD
jgi:hypothetical protein